MSEAKIRMDIEIRLRQQAQLTEPKDVQLFDAVHFELPDFSYCREIMERFHALGEEIRREEAEAVQRLAERVKL